MDGKKKSDCIELECWSFLKLGDKGMRMKEVPLILRFGVYFMATLII